MVKFKRIDGKFRVSLGTGWAEFYSLNSALAFISALI